MRNAHFFFSKWRQVAKPPGIFAPQKVSRGRGRGALSRKAPKVPEILLRKSFRLQTAKYSFRRLFWANSAKQICGGATRSLYFFLCALFLQRKSGYGFCTLFISTAFCLQPSPVTAPRCDGDFFSLSARGSENEWPDRQCRACISPLRWIDKPHNGSYSGPLSLRRGRPVVYISGASESVAEVQAEIKNEIIVCKADVFWQVAILAFAPDGKTEAILVRRRNPPPQHSDGGFAQDFELPAIGHSVKKIHITIDKIYNLL